MLSSATVRDFIEETIGEDVLPLIAFLKDKKNISEFVIAEKLNISIHQVRNMLYRLSHSNLLSSIRKKDKKKGWYIYYWSISQKEVEYATRMYLAKKLEEFRERLAREESEVFFVCPNACMRVKYETAMESDFKCNECGSLFVKDENKKTIANLKARIELLIAETQKYEETTKIKKTLPKKVKEKKKPVAVKPKKVKEKKKPVAVKPKKAKKSGKKKRT